MRLFGAYIKPGTGRRPMRLFGAYIKSGTGRSIFSSKDEPEAGR